MGMGYIEEETESPYWKVKQNEPSVSCGVNKKSAYLEHTVASWKLYVEALKTRTQCISIDFNSEDNKTDGTATFLFSRMPGSLKIPV